MVRAAPIVLSCGLSSNNAASVARVFRMRHAWVVRSVVQLFIMSNRHIHAEVHGNQSKNSSIPENGVKPSSA